MLIPNKIKILGLDWEVTRSKAIGHASSAYGTTVHATQSINVEPDLTPFHAGQTMLHETLHAIFDSMGLGKLPDMSAKVEEQIVAGIANGLFAVMRDNPGLFEGIQNL